MASDEAIRRHLRSSTDNAYRPTSFNHGSHPYTPWRSAGPASSILIDDLGRAERHHPGHPLFHSQEHPEAPVRHIVRQPYLHPTSTSAVPVEYSFPPSFAYNAAGLDTNHQVNSCRTSRRISMRREGPSRGRPEHGDIKHAAERRQHEEVNRIDPQIREPYYATQPFQHQPPYSPPGVQHPHYYEQPRQPVQHPEVRHAPYVADPYHGGPPPRQAAQSSRAVPISGLISTPNANWPVNHGYQPSSTAHSALSQPAIQQEPLFQMLIRQQPINARACGFGERDRRVIDPPPILQMVVNENVLAQAGGRLSERYPTSVVHCTLWHADEDVDDTTMPDSGERRQQRRLMGTLVSSPFVGYDDQGTEGCFFTFPDLSCRTSGRYRLRFVLVVIDPEHMGPGSRAPFESVVISDVFHVFAAKDFPGMRSSTALTKRLKEQGCLISVKKGNDKEGKKTGTHERDSASDIESGSEEEIAQPKTKPRRKPAAKKKRTSATMQ